MKNNSITPAVKHRRSILFLGGFRVANDGTEGGQVYACRKLIDSPLSSYVRWHKVDSTQRSLPVPGIHIRALDAARRILTCLSTLLLSWPQTVLVFTNFSPLSLAEKGFICIAAALFRRHVVISFRSFPKSPARFPRLYKRYLQLVCRCCNKIVCQSQVAADTLACMVSVNPKQVEIQPNWFDFSDLDAAPVKLAASPRSDLVRITFVGWMRDIKGLQYLLPAIKVLAERNLAFHVTLCGGGELLATYQRLCCDLGISDRIDFLGWVKQKDVFAILKQSDIFVLPSLLEGMPNALIQAQACGLPVVASNVSSIPSLVQDGVNGRLIPPASVEAIVEALHELIVSPETRARMGRLASDQARQRHDIHLVWRKLASILKVEIADNEVQIGSECAAQ